MSDEEEGFLDSTGGKVLTGIIVLAFIVGIIWYVRKNTGKSEAARMFSDRMFVCSETGKSFTVSLDPDMKIPVHSPYSGKVTGYPAELCYWTADGHVKSEPDGVLLNVYR